MATILFALTYIALLLRFCCKIIYMKYISTYLGNVIILAHELLIVGTDISHSGF